MAGRFAEGRHEGERILYDDGAWFRRELCITWIVAVCCVPVGLLLIGAGWGRWEYAWYGAVLVGIALVRVGRNFIRKTLVLEAGRRRVEIRTRSWLSGSSILAIDGAKVERVEVKEVLNDALVSVLLRDGRRIVIDGFGSADPMARLADDVARTLAVPLDERKPWSLFRR
jgi:hypothetical protein